MIVGVLVLMWTGPLLFGWLLSIIFAADSDFVVYSFSPLLRALWFHGIGVVTLAAIALGVSAVSRTSRTTTIVWIGLWLIMGTVAKPPRAPDWIKRASFTHDLTEVRQGIFRLDTALLTAALAHSSEVVRAWGVDGVPLVGFVGSLRPWHGVELLPGILEGIRERHGDVRLLVVGEGEMRARTESAMRERGLEDAAVFTGAVPHDDVPALIRSLDVALAPYPQPEHAFYFSPLKLFEYLACGVPIVAARIGQIAEVVDDGRTGLLHEPGDVDVIGSACCELLDDPDRAARMGAAAAEAAAAYTWDANVARVTGLVETLRARDRA